MGRRLFLVDSADGEQVPSENRSHLSPDGVGVQQDHQGIDRQKEGY